MLKIKKNNKNFKEQEDFPVKKSPKRILRDSVREDEMDNEVLEFYMNSSIHNIPTRE